MFSGDTGWATAAVRLCWFWVEKMMVGDVAHESRLVPLEMVMELSVRFAGSWTVKCRKGLFVLRYLNLESCIFTLKVDFIQTCTATVALCSVFADCTCIYLTSETPICISWILKKRCSISLWEGTYTKWWVAPVILMSGTLHLLASSICWYSAVCCVSLSVASHASLQADLSPEFFKWESEMRWLCDDSRSRL